MRTLLLFFTLLGAQSAWASSREYSRVFALGNQLQSCELRLKEIKLAVQSLDQKKMNYLQGQCKYVEKGQFSYYDYTKIEILYRTQSSGTIDTYSLEGLSGQRCHELILDLSKKFESIDQVIIDTYCLKTSSAKEVYKLGIARYQKKTWSFDNAYIQLRFTRAECESLKDDWSRGLETTKSLSLINKCQKVEDLDKNIWYQLSSQYATRISKTLKVIRATGYCSQGSYDQGFEDNELPVLFRTCHWEDGQYKEVLFYLDDILNSLNMVKGLASNLSSCEDALINLVAQYTKPNEPVLYSYCAQVDKDNYRPTLYYKWKKVRK
jgi:hypothetical protein